MIMYVVTCVSQITMTTAWLLLQLLIVSFHSVYSQSTTDDDQVCDGGHLSELKEDVYELKRDIRGILQRLGKSCSNIYQKCLISFMFIFTRCMSFFPKNCMYGTVFPRFRLCGSDLQFVAQFKYLGHMIIHNLSDDNDIQRENRSTFVHCRPNVLIRKFSNCSLRGKLKYFQSYCLYFYDIALWSSYTVSSLCKFYSFYNKRK